MLRKGARLFFLLPGLSLFLVLSASGCGTVVDPLTNGPQKPTSNLQPTPVTASQTPSLVGRPAPPFSLPTLSGESVSLQAFRGKVVLLVFLATW